MPHFSTAFNNLFIWPSGKSLLPKPLKRAKYGHQKTFICLICFEIGKEKFWFNSSSVEKHLGFAHAQIGKCLDRTGCSWRLACSYSETMKAYVAIQCESPLPEMTRLYFNSDKDLGLKWHIPVYKDLRSTRKNEDEHSKVVGKINGLAKINCLFFCK